jgi:hypothetical protein
VSNEGPEVFVDPLGDVNGDGFGDLWSISRGDPQSGFALFFGGDGNEGELGPDRATVIAAGKTAFGLYDVGDLNGDGIHDLAGFVQGAVSKDGWDIGIVLGRSTWPAEIPLAEIDTWIPGVDGEEPSSRRRAPVISTATAWTICSSPARPSGGARSNRRGRCACSAAERLGRPRSTATTTT